jgi:hypothetical protein
MGSRRPPGSEQCLIQKQSGIHVQKLQPGRLGYGTGTVLPFSQQLREATIISQIPYKENILASIKAMHSRNSLTNATLRATADLRREPVAYLRWKRHSASHQRCPSISPAHFAQDTHRRTKHETPSSKQNFSPLTPSNLIIQNPIPARAREFSQIIPDKEY